MKFSEYKEQVKRTLPDMGSFNDNPIILNSIHMVLGMFSEVYELEEGIRNGDEINVAEELTDIAWYICNYCNVRGIEPVVSLIANVDEVDADRLIANKERMVEAMSELQDYDKKEFAYTKLETLEIAKKRHILVNTIINNLDSCYTNAGIDCEKAMQNNIDKLRKRFPNKFNNEDANNRNLEIERKELEK